MKLRLVVMTNGNNRGKVLEITWAQFVIGRDPQCHLRPASPLISKRHCALVKKDGKAFIHDFDSTNGTLLNDQPVKGEVELSDGDRLQIGPLHFEVKIEIDVPIDKPTPMPAKTPAQLPQIGAKTPAPASPKPAIPAKAPAMTDEDEIAALLMGDDTNTGGELTPEKVPDGSTVMDLAAMQAKGKEGEPQAGATGEAAKPGDQKPKPQGDTRSAAENILKKYMKRPRA